MNPTRLLAHFHRICDAPDAIPRLRRFILDLAVRGKLVEQNTTDKHASDLVKRIAFEKDQLMKAGKAGKIHVEPLEQNEIPFAVPHTWAWTRLGEICSKTGSGSTPRGGKATYHDHGIPFLRSQNIHNDGLRLEDVAYIDQQTHLKMEGTAVKPADLLLNITGGSIGRCCRVPDRFAEANISQHVAIIRVALLGLQGFLHLLILSPYFQSFIFGEQTGAGRGGLPKNKMDRIPVALPPLVEQARIVAKVDELMALCDRLEAAQAERERRRDRLAAASLHRLNQPAADAFTFREHARFYLSHLSCFTSDSRHVSMLRQSIISLAVCGQLLPQDLNDEPIENLIAKVTNRFLGSGRAKKQSRRKTKAPQYPHEISDLPNSWTVKQLGDLVDPDNAISYGVLVPGDDVPGGIPFVRAQDLSLADQAVRPNKTISPEIERPYARTRLRGGEILLCVVGSIGKLGLAPPAWAGANIARAVARITTIPEISRDYVLLVLRSERSQRFFSTATRTLAQPTLNIGLVEDTPIPIPPIAEQHRIVAKVNQIMIFCDQLERQLAIKETEGRRLLDALLHQALHPVT